MSNILKNKMGLIHKLSGILKDGGCSSEEEYLEVIDSLVEMAANLERLENEVLELRPFKDSYYDVEFDSRCLKAFLSRLERLNGHEDVLDIYKNVREALIEEDIPF